MCLSPKEKEVLSLACLSNKQIAKKLNIDYQTVEGHFVRMFFKTHTCRRTDLLIRMLKKGILKLDEIYTTQEEVWT